MVGRLILSHGPTAASAPGQVLYVLHTSPPAATSRCCRLGLQHQHKLTRNRTPEETPEAALWPAGPSSSRASAILICSTAD